MWLISICFFSLFRFCSTAIVCCIYHKPKNFDESSDESSSDESSGSDESGDDGAARPARSHPRSSHSHRHQHSQPHEPRGESAATRDEGSGGGVVHELQDDPGPNAYESGHRKGKGKRKGMPGLFILCPWDFVD